MSDKVGKKTGKKTQAGKDVYKTPEGKNVSEISRTFKYKGKWINVPSIHKGREYDQDILELMLEAEVIKPTSTHDSKTKAEAAARDRSDRLKFDEGGLLDDKQKSFLDMLTSPLTGDYRKKKPISVKAADVAVDMTPVGSAVDIAEELGEEDPSIAKIGLIAAGDVLGAAIPVMGPVAKTLIKGGVKKLDEVVDVKDLTKNADTNALEEIGLTDEQLEAWKADNYAKDKYRIPRDPQLKEAAEKLRDGKLTQEEYIILSNQVQPIIPIEKMPKFPTKEEVIQALHATDKRKVEKGIVGINKTIPDGTKISARLDIPAYNDTDTWIVSLHDGTTKNGNTVGYAQTAVLDDVKFTSNPLAATSIAAGTPKTTIGRMNGSYVNAEPDEVYEYTKEILEGKAEDWTQVGMNPTRASYFYDKSDGMPVVSAEQVLQVGPLVMAYKIKKTTPDDEMFQFTNKRTGVTGNFNEGGMALEEQMMMNFGDVPDNTVGVDPVSGNEIPLGSTAENVRDDIPAQLSEGEMVIPADVVRFFGVKFFEDLRQAAKIGYSKMAEDGRIGGEPMDMEDETGLGLEMADLEVMEDGAPVEMYRGGTSMKDYQTSAAKKSFAQAAKRNPGRTGRKTHQQIMDQFRNNDNNSSSSGSKSTSSGSKSTSSGSKSTSFMEGKPSDYYSAENISKRVKARENQPKTKGEALYRMLQGYFFDNEDNKPDNRRVTLTEKPPTSDDERRFGTIDEQINFGNNFADDEETKKQRFKAEKPVVDKSKYTVTDLRAGEDPFFTKLAKNSGLDEIFEKLGFKFDEGGDVVDPDVVQEGTTGGFGEEIGLGDTGVMEAREYENAAGHVIIIMFLDGVPLQEIPDGYYPVGSEPIAVDPGEEAGTSSGGGGSSNDDDGPSAPAPTPVNFKELTMEELTQMVDDQKGMKNNVIAGGISYLNPIVGGAIKVAMWNTTRQTKNEIKRRLESDTTSNVDKMRYENLLDIANREEPGLVKVLLGKITGDYTGPELKSPKVVEGDVSDPTMAPDQGITEAYTPETKAPESPDAGIDYRALGEQASKEAAAIAFKDNPLYSGYKAPGTEDDDDDDDGGPTIKPTKPAAPTYTQPATDPYAEPGRPTTSNNNDDDDDGPTFAPPPPPSYTAPGGLYSEPGRPTKSSGRRPGGGGGKNKGGMMRKAKKKK